MALWIPGSSGDSVQIFGNSNNCLLGGRIACDVDLGGREVRAAFREFLANCCFVMRAARLSNSMLLKPYSLGCRREPHTAPKAPRWPTPTPWALCVAPLINSFCSKTQVAGVHRPGVHNAHGADSNHLRAEVARADAIGVVRGSIE